MSEFEIEIEDPDQPKPLRIPSNPNSRSRSRTPISRNPCAIPSNPISRLRSRTPISRIPREMRSSPRLRSRTPISRNPRAVPSNRCPVSGSRNQTSRRTRARHEPRVSLPRAHRREMTPLHPSLRASLRARRPSPESKRRRNPLQSAINRTRKKCWSKRPRPSTLMRRAAEPGSWSADYRRRAWSSSAGLATARSCMTPARSTFPSTTPPSHNRAGPSHRVPKTARRGSCSTALKSSTRAGIAIRRSRC